MQYALLIYSEESNLIDDRPEEEREAFYADFRKFSEALREAGAFVAAQRLNTVDTATTLRKQGDETLVTDGPFAETKECLAGFFLIDVENLDEALRWAHEIPALRLGPIEVRPVRY